MRSGWGVQNDGIMGDVLFDHFKVIVQEREKIGMCEDQYRGACLRPSPLAGTSTAATLRWWHTVARLLVNAPCCMALMALHTQCWYFHCSCPQLVAHSVGISTAAAPCRPFARVVYGNGGARLSGGRVYMPLLFVTQRCSATIKGKSVIFIVYFRFVDMCIVIAFAPALKADIKCVWPQELCIQRNKGADAWGCKLHHWSYLAGEADECSLPDALQGLKVYTYAYCQGVRDAPLVLFLNHFKGVEFPADVFSDIYVNGECIARDHTVRVHSVFCIQQRPNA
eukprot:scaffold5849_cov21-Tisochrysis_lutea.AAC.3